MVISLTLSKEEIQVIIKQLQQNAETLDNKIWQYNYDYYKSRMLISEQKKVNSFLKKLKEALKGSE